MRAKVAQIKQI